MFKRKRIKNFSNRVHRIYGRKFSYIEHILNSCVTLDQLDYAARWASTVMTQYEGYEKRRIDKLYDLFTYLDLHDVISKYFGLKQEIIGLIFERKVREIEKQETMNGEE